MKTLLLSILTKLVDVLVFRLARKVTERHVYTYQRGNDNFLVGYWTDDGDFIERASVDSESKARALVRDLNRQTDH